MTSIRRTTERSASLRNEENDDDDLLDPASFRFYAKENFVAGVRFKFMRKVINHAILKHTPAKDKKICAAICKVLLRFMGDQADYRSNLDASYQPYLGSVMSRLYTGLEITPALAELWKEKESLAKSERDETGSNLSGPAMSSIRRNKSGGTLKRMKATLTSRFLPKERRSEESIWASLPLEESLMSPLEQIHFIIGCGIVKPYLRDEIYTQICKQVTDNPFKSSVTRGWILLTLVCSTFAPSDKIMKAMVHFLGTGPPIFSVNCKKALQRTLQNGDRNQPPSYMETEAATQKTMLEVDVTLMDGSQHALTVDSSTTAKEFSAHLAETAELQEQFGFSLYISMLDKVASLGNGGDFLFDAVSQCEQIYRDQGNPEGSAPWRLFYRKELFSPWESSLSDNVATRLIYAQVVRGVMLGEYVCEQDNQLSMLAAQQYFIEYGSDISEEGLTALLPSYIPPEKLIDEDALPKWKRQIVKTHEKLFLNNPARTVDRVKQEVVHFAKTKWPMSFSRYYDVKKLEGPNWPNGELCLAVNWTGVYILNDGETIFEMAYPEITAITDGGSPTGHVIMFFLINGAAFKFNCKDGLDVQHLVKYMLNGLRCRSVYAIATETYQAASPAEISFQETDLILLTTPVDDVTPGEIEASAVNERTGDVGNVHLDRIYRLATLARPSDDLLRVLQRNKKQVPRKHQKMIPNHS